MDNWYLDNLVCPRDHSKLHEINSELICANSHRYPVVDGIPIMLLDDVEQTIGVADTSIKRAKGVFIDERAPHLYLESLGISEYEKKGIINLSLNNKYSIDPVVSYMCAAAGGYSYKHLIGRLSSYPIPEIPLPFGNNSIFLDIGCNWGRWCIAAYRRGYNVIGVDPSMGAIMAAKRVSKELGLSIKYLVADGRWLPFNNNSLDNVFSYSVLQHLSRNNAKMLLLEIARILKPRGRSLIQMPNAFGIRSLYNQIRRKFAEPKGFEVRYYSIPSLKKIFSTTIGKTKVKTHCYFGLGVELSDLKFMPKRSKFVIILSELTKRLSKYVVPLVYVADSVYVESVYEKIDK